jgi:hypothetical protein
MPTSDALGTRIASIPIFETLGFRLGITGDGARDADRALRCRLRWHL